MATQAYDKIADALLAMTDEAGKWKPCWHRMAGLTTPANAVSKHRYSGINVLSLWVSAELAGYSSGLWATYQQWLSIGAQVRKGEKGTAVVLFKTYSADSADGEAERRRVSRGFTVFNAAQVDGYELPNASAPTNPDAQIEAADAWVMKVREAGAVVLHIPGCATPCYIPSEDRIHMPPYLSFHHATGYYGTLLHELGHWTGHKSRCDRKLGNRFGSDGYALEELVAELSAAFLAADLGIEAEPREDHAQYLAHWHRVLKGDRAAFMHAVGEASKAAGYLHSLQGGESERVAA